VSKEAGNEKKREMKKQMKTETCQTKIGVIHAPKLSGTGPAERSAKI
jgi:hypothetical protein